MLDRAAMGLVIGGERIYLRPLHESDLEDFYIWYKDSQVTKFLGMKPLTRGKARALLRRLLNDSNGVYFTIIKKDEKRTIGYVFLADILKSHKVALELGIVIGDKDLWGQRYGSEAIKLAIGYGFKRLKLHRIQLIVLDFNKRARHTYRKLGFVEEGVQREARLVGGRWHDVIMMGMLKKEYTK